MNQRLGLGAVAGEALREHLRRIVDTDLFATLAHLRDTGFDPLEQRTLVDAQFDNRVELEVLLLQQFVQRLRLRHGARKTVEDETLLRVRLFDAIRDNSDHDLVRHQRAAGHDVLRLEADRRSGCNSGTEHLSGGELNDTVLVNQSLRLRSLARPRRPEKNQPHLRRPLSFDLRISPSYWCASR